MRACTNQRSHPFKIPYVFRGTRKKHFNPKQHTKQSISDSKVTNKHDFNYLHSLLAHANKSALRATSKNLDIELTGKMKVCDGCQRAKQKAKAMGKVSTSPATRLGQRLLIDTSGRYPKSVGGHIYWVKAMNEYTRKCWDYYVKRSPKSQILSSTILTAAKDSNTRSNPCAATMLGSISQSCRWSATKGE
jgi:hypothetical protein